MPDGHLSISVLPSTNNIQNKQHLSYCQVPITISKYKIRLFDYHLMKKYHLLEQMMCKSACDLLIKNC